MNLFQLGKAMLNSGAESYFKIDCDSLSEGSIVCLAQMIREMVGPFSSVEGIPQGGLRLAAALVPLRSFSGPHLIVDDVLTTGGSMERAKTVFWQERGNWPGSVVGAVLFARGQCPHWIKAVCQLPECFWLQGMHR